MNYSSYFVPQQLQELGKPHYSPSIAMLTELSGLLSVATVNVKGMDAINLAHTSLHYVTVTVCNVLTDAAISAPNCPPPPPFQT